MVSNPCLFYGGNCMWNTFEETEIEIVGDKCMNKNKWILCPIYGGRIPAYATLLLSMKSEVLSNTKF